MYLNCQTCTSQAPLHDECVEFFQNLRRDMVKTATPVLSATWEMNSNEGKAVGPWDECFENGQIRQKGSRSWVVDESVVL